MVSTVDIKVLKSYPNDNVWNVVISFPEVVEGLKANPKITAPLDYLLYQIQGWTDEPVDLNELRLVAFNEDTNEYKLVKADDETVPERVQSEMLSAAREAMQEAENRLTNE